ncbi:MAG: DUF6788 family protein [Bryobacteraceae bacterium]
MPLSLPDLEADRTRILREFSNLGDFRPGSLCAVTRRCGKPGCHCVNPNDPGHDPQLRLTRKVAGRTVAETISSPASLQKAKTEIAEFQHFRQLSAELTAVNEKICRLRPVEQAPVPWSAEEKKRVLQSISRSRGK